MGGLKERPTVIKKKKAEFILKSQDNWFPGGKKGSSKRPRGAGRELWIRKRVQMAVNGYKSRW